MPGRPVPLTRTDELLAHLIDEVAGLRADLSQRGGAAPATPAAAPSAGKQPRKKSTGKTPTLDGL